MKKIALIPAAVAFAVGLGLAGAAMAQDPEADMVAAGGDGINDASCGGDCAGSATDTLEAADTVFASLGTGGFVKLNFTDNFCFVAAGPDVTVTEIGALEDYDGRSAPTR